MANAKDCQQTRCELIPESVNIIALEDLVSKTYLIRKRDNKCARCCLLVFLLLLVIRIMADINFIGGNRTATLFKIHNSDQIERSKFRCSSHEKKRKKHAKLYKCDRLERLGRQVMPKPLYL
jgi:hypothetical protein